MLIVYSPKAAIRLTIFKSKCFINFQALHSCFDTLHAVLPTRLPRELFYQKFADLYSQSDLGPYYDLVQAGKMTIEDCKNGKIMLDTMADWQHYIEKDPILGTKM